jgi:antitoxin (DNA-binding transcriptional repressor) of toxin-antitoxin stability system
MNLPQIRSATDLRAHLYESLREVSEGTSMMITHKQGDPVVMLSQAGYQDLLHEIDMLKKLTMALSEVNRGEVLSQKKIEKKLKKKFK